MEHVLDTYFSLAINFVVNVLVIKGVVTAYGKYMP
jgi:hypothetical protein